MCTYCCGYCAVAVGFIYTPKRREFFSYLAGILFTDTHSILHNNSAQYGVVQILCIVNIILSIIYLHNVHNLPLIPFLETKDGQYKARIMFGF